MRNAEEILAKLMEDPTIQEQVKAIEAGLDTPELRDLCNFYHSLFCFEDHELTCRWYIEHDLSNAWSEYAHKSWLNRTREFLSNAPERSFGETRLRLRKILEVATFLGGLADVEINILDDACTQHAITVFKS